MWCTTKTLLNLACVGLFGLSFNAFALQSDTSQPINVESVEQSADLQANRIVFSGDVIATQGSIKVKADKIEISRNTNGSLKSIVAYGSPVTFEQQQDNGRLIKSRSSILSYNPQDASITLQGRAVVWQGESKITGEKIEYNITSQRLKASSKNQGSRVSSTFVPSDFSKSNK